MANRSISAACDTGERSVRLSVSLPSKEYAVLDLIAQSQRVSIAWVVREAVHLYLAKQPASDAKANNDLS